MVASLQDYATSGIQRSPLFIVVYGPSKIGKSELSTWAPNSTMICIERKGVDRLDHDSKLVPETLKDLKFFMRLAAESDKEWVIFDNITFAELMLKEKMFEDHGISSLKDLPHGGAYTELVDKTITLITAMHDLREKHGKNVCVLAHAKNRTELNLQTLEDEKHIAIGLRPDSADFLTRVSDGVFYLDLLRRNREVSSNKERGKKAVPQKVGGKRIIQLSHTAGVESGTNLVGLPENIKFNSQDDYYHFWDALSEHYDFKKQKKKGKK